MQKIIDEMNKIKDSTQLKTFGILLYTDSNVHIKKLLKDNDYWNALNEVSGDKFIVFSVKPTKGNYQLPTNNKLGNLNLLVPIWNEPKDNKDILEVFEIQSTENLPVFVLFTKFGEYLLQYPLHINENSVEEAYRDLKELLSKIAKKSEKLNIEYNEHPVQIHDKLAVELKKIHGISIVNDVISFYKKIKNMISPIEKILKNDS